MEVKIMRKKSKKSENPKMIVKIMTKFKKI